MSGWDSPHAVAVSLSSTASLIKICSANLSGLTKKHHKC
uniref:Uncharacterized protein n=1 Tax=Anguilla anguilla TaxID=7936 RepID=A0A0E9R0Z0_ANGAN